MARPKGIYTSKLDPYRNRILYLYEICEYSTLRIAKMLPFSGKRIHQWLTRHGHVRNQKQAARIRHGLRVESHKHTPRFMRLIRSVDRDIKDTSDNDWTIARKYNCSTEFVRRQRKFYETLP